MVWRNGIIEKLDIKTDKTVYRDSAVSKFLHEEILIFNNFTDAKNELWIYACGSMDEPDAFFKYNPANAAAEEYGRPPFKVIINYKPAG